MTMTDQPKTGRCDCSRCQVHDSGVQGPFTPRQFMELFTLVEPTGTGYEATQEVLDAAAAVDDALAVYEATCRDYTDAYRDLQQAVRAPADEQRDAESVLQMTRAALDRDGERLRRARVAYNEAAKAQEHQRIVAEVKAAAAERRAIEAARVAVDAKVLEQRRSRWRGVKGSK